MFLQNIRPSCGCRSRPSQLQAAFDTPGPQAGKPSHRQDLHPDKALRFRVGNVRNIQANARLVSTKLDLFIMFSKNPNSHQKILDKVETNGKKLFYFQGNKSLVYILHLTK